MSFVVTGPLFLVLEDLSGGYLTDPMATSGWTKEGQVWTADTVLFPQAPYGAVGFCVIDEDGMKVAPSVRFAEGVATGRKGDDLEVTPSIEFVKEYA